MERERVGEFRVQGRNVCLDRVGECVHSGVGGKLRRHGLRDIGIDDGNIGRDVEIGKRVFDTLFVIGYHGKCSDLGRTSRR